MSSNAATSGQSQSEKIENCFKVNVTTLVNFLSSNFSCSKTTSQLKLLQTIVFPSPTFVRQMILQWHKSMEPFYGDVDAGRLDSMLESKSVWFVERIDFAVKYQALSAEERVQVANYFKGLNKLAKSYALIYSSDLARLVATTAAAKASELPEMPSDAKEQAMWAVTLTQEVLGSLSKEQMQQIVNGLPLLVEAMGGADKVLEQARALALVSEEGSEAQASPMEGLEKLLSPDLIRPLVAGLQDNVRDVTVPAKGGDQVPLSDIVGDTTKVLTDIVEGKADASQVAGLGQKLTETVDWDQIMGLLPPEISTAGRTLVSSLMSQTAAATGASAEGGAEEGAASGAGSEPVDMSKVMETVTTLASSIMTPDSPFSQILQGLMQSASSGGENPLAQLLSPRK